MKKVLVGIVIAASLLSLSVSALAGATANGRITQINIPVTGQFVRISLDTPTISQGCGGADYYMVELDNSIGNNRFLSALLAAHAANKPVAMWIDGCTTGLYWGATRPRALDIYINQ